MSSATYVFLASSTISRMNLTHERNPFDSSELIKHRRWIFDSIKIHNLIIGYLFLRRSRSSLLRHYYVTSCGDSREVEAFKLQVYHVALRSMADAVWNDERGRSSRYLITVSIVASVIRVGSAVISDGWYRVMLNNLRDRPFDGPARMRNHWNTLHLERTRRKWRDSSMWPVSNVIYYIYTYTYI